MHSSSGQQDTIRRPQLRGPCPIRDSDGTQPRIACVGIPEVIPERALVAGTVWAYAGPAIARKHASATT